MTNSWFKTKQDKTKQKPKQTKPNQKQTKTKQNKHKTVLSGGTNIVSLSL
jgi:hypothetical protein